ncbi:hypothetical protein L596_024417 [Steinernema carpocapsae]|uniref:RGS domain-containing protein n=1 Tax=Steinernema carpocapsae TaxID=34508 RepID=A0A4U5MGP0_STECR|nr:hypothetical protein L596_024417 [Steinernema carpocapsae]
MNGFLSKIRSKKGNKSPFKNGSPPAPQEAEFSASCGNEPLQVSDEKAARIQRFARSTSIVHTLKDTIRDAGAIPYFIQFMESLGQLHLIKFLLHVDGFKASAQSTIGANNGDLVHLSKEDAGNIYSQYICVDGAMSLGLPEQLRKIVIDRVCSHDGSIDAGSFDAAYEHVKKILDDRYFKQFLLSVYYNKHLIDVLSGGALSLADILKTQLLLCAFIDFLDIENARSYLEFLIAAESFCEEIKECADDTQALDDAMIIYDKFFSMQATDSLNMGDKVRMMIEENICTASGRPETDCFKSPMKIALVTLQDKYVTKFVHSESYLKVLNELISSVANYIEMPEGSRSKATSTNASSLTSQTTLPNYSIQKRYSDVGTLVDLGKVRLRLGSASGSRLLSTEEEAFDDTLSQCSSNSAFGITAHFRRNRSGMSLAKVDEFGRYSPRYASAGSDGESTKGRIRNTLEKYLHQSTTKEREIADQVAQLIIADVQNMVSEANSVSMSSRLSIHRSSQL